MESLRLDLRYALRTIAKTPAFSALLIVTLALGIGANTAMFSIVDAVLFRPLPAKNPEQLVRIFSFDEKEAQTDSLSYPVYTDYRDRAQSFQSIAGYSDWNDVNVSTEGRSAEQVNASIVTGNFFGLLGTKPAMGRLIGQSDDRVKGKHPVLVISNHFWKEYFDSNPDVVGKTIRVNGTVFAIIGVTTPQFTGTGLEHIPELWMPMAMVDVFLPEFASMNPLEERRFSWLDSIARLKKGVSLEQAQAELRTIAARRAAKQVAPHKDPSARLVAAQNAMIDVDGSASVSKISWLLLSVTLVVLLIAVAVASGLLLVKAEQRQKEVAVRLAMGATRFQIIRQLLLESFLLSGIAAVAGLFFALWSTDLLAGVVGSEGFTLPVNAATPLLNPRVLAATVALSSIAAFLFGLVPAVLSSRAQLLPSLKNEALHAGRNRALSLKNIFIVTQVAFSILLLVGAGLLLRTLWKTRAVNPGFDASHAVVASIDVAKQGYDEASGKIFYDTLLSKMKNSPGIQSVALARTVPVQNSGMRVTFENLNLAADLNIVSPGFFRTLSIPVIRGRDFQLTDTGSSTRVGILNEAMARRLWPNQNPIGKILKDVGPDSQSVEIVGVVPDVKFRSLQTPADPMLYAPLSQWYMSSMTIVASSQIAPEATLLQLQNVMGGLDKTLPLFSVQTLRQKLERSLVQERVLAGLLTIFGALALLLAAVGLYSLLSFITQSRTREIGVRMAIGAQRSDVLRVFLTRGLALAMSGIAVGVLISLSAGTVIRNLLFDVTPSDAWTYFAITLLMTVTAFAASYIPARRAANLDPVKALRYE